MAVGPVERQRSPRPSRPGRDARRDDADTVARIDATTDNPLGAQAIVGLLATSARLRVAAAIILGASTTVEVAVATGLAETEAVTAINRLVRGRLVRVVDGAFSVDPDVFATAAREGAAARGPVDYGVSDPKVAAILHAFLVDGRLTRIPASGRKRTAVLEYLVATFEPGQRYPEADVNAMLASFHPDTAGRCADTWSTRGS